MTVGSIALISDLVLPRRPLYACFIPSLKFTRPTYYSYRHRRSNFFLYDIRCESDICQSIVTYSRDWFVKYPETATFLTVSEREYLVQLLKEDSNDQATHFEWKFFWQAVTDYKTYLLIMVE